MNLKKRSHLFSAFLSAGSKKRGQLTIFVILGVVIVVGIVAYYVYQSTADDRYFREGTAADDVNNIKEYMVSCLDYVADESLDIVQLQAGYYNPPTHYEDFGNETFLPYYTYEGVSYAPNINTIEGELATAMESSAPDCVSLVEFSGYDVTYSTVHTTAEIRDGEVEFVVDMPLTISTQGHTMILDLKEYPIVKRSNLKGMYNVAQYYTDDIVSDNEYCVNCLAEVAEANRVYVDVIGTDETTSTVIISEDYISGQDGNYSYFIFFNKFSEGAFSDNDFLDSLENY